jgi:hypothetical protein
MTDRELMQQALSVLCNNVYPRDGVRDNRQLTPKSHAAIYQQTIDDLFNRLAQPEQEPVAWMVYTQDGQSVYVTDNPIDIQEGQRDLPLYAAPRQWVGLTDDEIKSLPSWWPSYEDAPALIELVKDVEAKLKEKNNG